MRNSRSRWASWSYSKEVTGTLEVFKEPLEFEEFPYTRHTSDNIKAWILKVLNFWGLPPCECVGITPDGEKAGVSALWYIEDLREYVDVCLLHQLQRSVLFAIGLAGTRCLNSHSRLLLRKNARIVKLEHQSRPVIDGVNCGAAKVWWSATGKEAPHCKD